MCFSTSFSAHCCIVFPYFFPLKLSSVGLKRVFKKVLYLNVLKKKKPAEALYYKTVTVLWTCLTCFAANIFVYRFRVFL